MNKVVMAFVAVLVVIVMGMGSFNLLAWADDNLNVNVNVNRNDQEQEQEQVQSQAQEQGQDQGQTQTNNLDLVNNERHVVPVQLPQVWQTGLMSAPQQQTSFWNTTLGKDSYLPRGLCFEGRNALNFRRRGSLKVKHFTPYMHGREYKRFSRASMVRLFRAIPPEAVVIGSLALRVTRSFTDTFAVSRAMQETYLHHGNAFVLLEYGGQTINTGHSRVHGGLPIPFGASRGSLSSRLGSSGQRGQSRQEIEPYVKGLIVRVKPKGSLVASTPFRFTAEKEFFRSTNVAASIKELRQRRRRRGRKQQRCCRGSRRCRCSCRRSRKRRPVVRMTWDEQRIAAMRLSSH